MPSRKRSDTAQPPEGLTVFLDRCLGREPIRTRLSEQNLIVKLHDEYFKRDEKDENWLPEVAKRGWIIFTKDARIRYRPLEKAAFSASGTAIFILNAGNLRAEAIANAFVLALPDIRRMVARRAGSLMAYVTSSGNVRVVS